MIFKRLLFQKLKKYLHDKEAILITGARQVGKTTLLQSLYDLLPSDQRLWFDFENPLNRKIFEENDYNDIVQKFEALGISKKKRKYIFIDEIQFFPEITKIMKYLIDHFQIKFFVTGSASYYMKNLFPESLSGRKFLFELFPLTFAEFLYFKEKTSTLKTHSQKNWRKKDVVTYEQYDQDYQEYKKYGGFPKVVLTDNREKKKMILENIFTSYFEKDVISFGGFTEVREIRDLILLLSVRVGAKLDITKLAKHISTSRQKIYNYLDFLEKTYFISLVSPFSKSIDRKVAGGKKIYFIDSGLFQILGDISQGQILENTIYNQLRHYGRLDYFQTKSGNEIDFILEKKIAFEVKKAAIDWDEINLQKLASKLGIKSRYVISEQFTNKVKNIIYPQNL